MRYTRVRVNGDSKLIVKQLTGEWRCKAPNLQAYYERGLALSRHQSGISVNNLKMSHVYREFNADADSLANFALDHRTNTTPVAVNDNWFNTSDNRSV